MALTQVQSQMLGGNNPAVPTATSVGNQALNSNSGSNNTAVGYQAGYTNSTGTNNTFLGGAAGYTNSTASYNTAVGYNALTSNSTGVENTAVGEAALGSTTASYNTAVGRYALKSNSTGQGNTALGWYAGYGILGATSNTLIGNSAGTTITSGSYNVVIGSQDNTLTTGQYNIQIGKNANASSASVSYSLIINSDNTARVDKGNGTGYIYAGGAGIYNGTNSSSWATTSDQRLKKNIVDNNIGLEKITAIQVRNFEYRLPEEVDAELKPTDAIEKTGVQLGVIAQELQQVLPECVRQESTKVLSVDTDNLTWYLINAVKELNAKVTALETQLAAK